MDLRVKEICKEKGITMEQLAINLHITPNTLTRNINGNPTIETLEKIANALKVEFWELFTSDTSKHELTALIEYKNTFYKADTLDGLKDIIKKIEKSK